MTATMTKLKAEPTTPSFETAKARWAEIDIEHQYLLEQHEGMGLALALTHSGGNGQMSQHLRDKAKPFLALANKRRKKLIEQQDDLAYEIVESKPKYQAEHELWQAARRRETSRIALKLQPRHRDDVKAIAKALEDLSRSLAAEMETRAELARKAPEQSSAYLPNCSGFLGFGSLADWNSPASQWAREMRRLGILE